MSLAVVLGVLINVILLSWSWLGGRLNFAQSPATDLATGAQEAFERGDLDSAVNLSQQALVTQPENITLLTLLARALVYRSYTDYYRAGDRQSALELTSDALSRSPNNLDILAAHAFALQADEQPAIAAQIAERVLQRDPSNVLARTAMALAYGSVGSFEIAMRESLRASQAESDFQLDALRALAISYSDLGDYQNASSAVMRAIQLNNRLTPLYFERALYAMQRGDADTATTAYFQILSYDPENVKARLRLCELSSLMRERDSAIDYCEQVTSLAPNWSDGWYQLGREYFLQGDFAAAQSHLHRCASLQVMQGVPVDARRFECWYLQGQAAEIIGDCESLVATYNEFRAMAASESVQQTWTYPPEGPPGCVTLTPVT